MCACVRACVRVIMLLLLKDREENKHTKILYQILKFSSSLSIPPSI